MIGCMRTRVRKQPIIALYFESENDIKFYNLKTRNDGKAIIGDDAMPCDWFSHFRLLPLF